MLLEILATVAGIALVAVVVYGLGRGVLWCWRRAQDASWWRGA